VGARTTGREAALQMLFAIESTQTPVDIVTRDFWREIPPPDVEGRAFADSLLREVIAKREWLDEKIAAASENWRLDRMTPVDRSILRLGSLELLAHPEVPTARRTAQSSSTAYSTASLRNGVLPAKLRPRTAPEVTRGASIHAS
jgi:N utilization substance protein B